MRVTLFNLNARFVGGVLVLKALEHFKLSIVTSTCFVEATQTGAIAILEKGERNAIVYLTLLHNDTSRYLLMEIQNEDGTPSITEISATGIRGLVILSKGGLLLHRKDKQYCSEGSDFPDYVDCKLPKKILCDFEAGVVDSEKFDSLVATTKKGKSVEELSEIQTLEKQLELLRGDNEDAKKEIAELGESLLEKDGVIGKKSTEISEILESSKKYEEIVIGIAANLRQNLKETQNSLKKLSDQYVELFAASSGFHREYVDWVNARCWRDFPDELSESLAKFENLIL